MYPNVEDCVVEVGKKYYVQSCLRKIYNISQLWIPILDKLHNDGYKSNYLDHFHVDERFIDDVMFKKLYDNWAYYKVDYANNLLAIAIEEQYSINNLILERRLWKCIREQPITRNNNVNFTDVDIFSKKGREQLTLNLNCKICPHKGFNLTNIKAVNGVITCPMHHLKYCEKTGKLLNRVPEYVNDSVSVINNITWKYE